MNEALAEYFEARDSLADLGRRYRAGEAIPLAQIERAARRKIAAAERMRGSIESAAVQQEARA
ncbi:hypothetical protein GCM10010471_07700 [Leucobacter komagatae]